MKTIILVFVALGCISSALSQRDRFNPFGPFGQRYPNFDFDDDFRGHFGDRYHGGGDFRREENQCPKNLKSNEYCTPIPRSGYDDYRAERPMSEFSWNLFQATNRNGDENFAVSPICPQILLTYLSWTANGTTKQELANAVKINDPKSIQRVVGDLNSNDQYRGENTKELDIATAMFIANDLKLNSAFVKKASKDINLNRVNFGNGEAEEAFKTWVKEKTKNLIQMESNFDANTRLSLVSSIYFKAKWLFEFEPAQPSPFKKLNGQEVNIPMMSQENRQYKYGKVEDLASWLAIPYRSDEAMVFIRPNDDKNVDDVINQLKNSDFAKIMSGVSEEENEYRVNLTIPKFKLETSSSMIEPLRKLGVKKLFQPGADLSYLTRDGVYVSEVKQQTSVDVNEEGTVLVSVTKVNAIGLSVQRRLLPVTFVIDKPFIAMIVNTAKNVPYVLCKITDPKY